MQLFNARRHLLTFWVRPGKTIKAIAAGEPIPWLLPLLFVSLCLLWRIFALGMLKLNQEAMVQIPLDFQYYLPEEQQRLQEALAMGNGPLFVFFFPALGSLGTLWLEWLLMSGLLTVGLRIGGGKVRGRNVRALCAWSFLPIGLRFAIQGLYVLAAGTPIQQSGLASLLASPGGPGMNLPAMMLGVVDLYFLWQVFILFKGSRMISGRALWRVALPVLLAAVGVLLFDSISVTVANMLGAAITG